MLQFNSGVNNCAEANEHSDNGSLASLWGLFPLALGLTASRYDKTSLSIGTMVFYKDHGLKDSSVFSIGLSHTSGEKCVKYIWLLHSSNDLNPNWQHAVQQEQADKSKAPHGHYIQ